MRLIKNIRRHIALRNAKRAIKLLHRAINNPHLKRHERRQLARDIMKNQLNIHVLGSE